MEVESLRAFSPGLLALDLAFVTQHTSVIENLSEPRGVSHRRHFLITVGVPFPIAVTLLGLVLAAPAAAMALARGFDGLYGQDAYAYFEYGAVSVRQSLLHLSGLEPFFWPPGYPLLVALTSLLLGPTPLAGQAVSLVMGAAVPVLTALLVREIWPEDTPLALLAGALVALCGQLWQSSIVVMADTTGLALATFSAWALVRYARSASAIWLVAASAAIAYATLARWIYGLVAIPFALFALVCLFGAAARLWHAVAALAVATLILLPVLGPSLLGLLTHPADPAAFAGNLQVYSWSALNALRRDFFTADGHLEYTLPNGVYYAIAPANLAFFGPLLVPWLVLGLWAARRWRPAHWTLVLGWAAIVYAFHAGAPWQNFRFTLAYLPPLAIVLAAGILSIWRFGASGQRARALRSVVTVWVALGLLASAAAAVRLVEGFIDRKDEDLALVRWVQAQTPPDAELFSFGPTLAFRHYTHLETVDLFDLTPPELQALLAQERRPRYVILDEPNVQDQWLDQAPWRNFVQLRDGPGLTPLGAEGAYTLYRVGRGP